MPRIAIACRHIAGITGATTIILEHARRLSRVGWEVHLYGEKLDLARIRQAGAWPHALMGWPWGSYLKRRLFAWRCERAIKAQGFDLVCGNGDVLAQDVLSLHNCVHAAYEAVHGLPMPEEGVGRLHREILERGRWRLLIANSELMKRELHARFNIPSEKIAVIHPGHDPKRFCASDRQKGAGLRRSLGAGPGDVVLGLITSGDFAKRGVGVFLRALGRLSPAAKARTLAVIVGQETRLKPYERLAVETGLGDRIRFFKPTSDIENTYHALDVYVHPAFYEEFGLSVEEAMACGLPVVTTQQVGAAELLSAQARGRLLKRPEPEALSQALEPLILDEGLRKRLGTENAAACRANTWDLNFQKTLACYETVLS